MQIDKLFVEELNYNYPDQPLRSPELENPDYNGKITDVSLMFEQKGFNIIVITLQDMRSDLEKAVIDKMKKEYPDSAFLFKNTDGSEIHVCHIGTSDSGKKKISKLIYSEINKKRRLFKEKIRCFEVTRDIVGRLELKEKIDREMANTEKITKKFYDEFKKFHKKFLNFIDGINMQQDKEWYASVMLNRLMFIYFIQKKGFIDGNYNYLRDKYNGMSANNPDATNFYDDFLMEIFFSGFAIPEDKRSDNFKSKFGEIPYLDGGLFWKHDLEIKYPQIKIKNKIFGELIKYFDKYTWYLDDRPLQDENEINPDVLGYIFEKYINQKQMGAYYTKEDITGYISRNTIVPFIIDKINENMKTKEHPLVSKYAPKDKKYLADPNEMITKNEDPLRYLLSEISKSKDDEFLHYLYFEVLKKIKILDPAVGSGAFLFAALNILYDLYSATIKRFKLFIRNDRIINGVRTRKGKKKSTYTTKFEKEQDTIRNHASQPYFIIKSIIINNLYGVDIMDEAVEICKLRLFLKLVSQAERKEQLEPLPDIDFNIKTGNTLIGLERIDDFTQRDKMKFGEEEELIKEICHYNSRIDVFRKIQTESDELFGRKISSKEKEEIKEEGRKINDKINKYLVAQYERFFNSRKIRNKKRYIEESFKPFHWCVEFMEIFKDEGFDVVIGNPPYVEYKGKLADEYPIEDYFTKKCKNLYAYILEKSIDLLRQRGRFGLIIPLSAFCTDRMVPLQNFVLKRCDNIHISNYAIRPGKLFEGADQRLSIIVANADSKKKMKKVYTTNYNRWDTEKRDNLFNLIEYTDASEHYFEGSIPKIGNEISKKIITKIKLKKETPHFFQDKSSKILYYHNAPRYWIRAMDFKPYFWNERDGEILSSHNKKIEINPKYSLKTLVSILNSSLFYFHFILYSNCRDLTSREINNFGVGLDVMDKDIVRNLEKLCDELMEDYKKNSIRKECHYKTTGKVIYDEFYPKKSKHIIDRIDRELAKHYGFTEEELDFIINYDIKYRMGKE